jgi:hypothetical protein
MWQAHAERQTSAAWGSGPFPVPILVVAADLECVGTGDVERGMESTSPDVEQRQVVSEPTSLQSRTTERPRRSIGLGVERPACADTQTGGAGVSEAAATRPISTVMGTDRAGLRSGGTVSQFRKQRSITHVGAETTCAFGDLLWGRRCRSNLSEMADAAVASASRGIPMQWDAGSEPRNPVPTRECAPIGRARSAC